MENKVLVNLEEYVQLRQESETLQNILKIIIDNSRLDYLEEKLALDEDKDLMTYLSIAESTIYNDKLAELKKGDENE